MKSYVGATTNPKRRFRCHLSQLRRKVHHSVKLQRAYSLYGRDSLEFIILEESDRDIGESSQLEQKWIDELDSYNNGYNARQDATWLPAGELNGQFGKPPPKQDRSKTYKPVVSYNLDTKEVLYFKSIAEAIKVYGHPHICSCLTKPDKNRRFKNYLFFYLKDFTEENLKIKLDNLNINKLVGRKRDKSECDAISKGRLGMKFSETHRQNMSKSRIGKSQGGLKVIRSDGKIYPSVAQAGIDSGFNRYFFTHKMKSGQRDFGEYSFEYYSPTPPTELGSEQSHS